MCVQTARFQHDWVFQKCEFEKVPPVGIMWHAMWEAQGDFLLNICEGEKDGEVKQKRDHFSLISLPSWPPIPK